MFGGHARTRGDGQEGDRPQIRPDLRRWTTTFAVISSVEVAQRGHTPMPIILVGSSRFGIARWVFLAVGGKRLKLRLYRPSKLWHPGLRHSFRCFPRCRAGGISSGGVPLRALRLEKRVKLIIKPTDRSGAKFHPLWEQACLLKTVDVLAAVGDPLLRLQLGETQHSPAHLRTPINNRCLSINMAHLGVARSIKRLYVPAMAITQEERAYTTGEVAAAAGLSRGTFDAWLLRKHLPLPPGPGKGGTRLFTLFDAVMVTLAAELVSLEISIAFAARVVDWLSTVRSGGMVIPLDEPGWAVLVTTTKWKRANPDKVGPVEFGFLPAREVVDGMEQDPDIAARVVIDFSKVAARVREALGA